MNDAQEIATRYERFAERAAPGRSPLYVELSRAVAADGPALAFLAAMPPPKRQPNLLFGAIRLLYGTPAGAEELLELIRDHGAEIGAVMAERTTQTNEPARCATLLPLLARLAPPLALIEVGASGGLCLLPDRYAYDYAGRRVEPSDPPACKPPVFGCRAGPGVPVPERNVEVAWRAGLDLNPLDLGDDAQLAWLEALVWPGEEYRIPRLRAAVEVARADPPRVVAGDLRADLGELAAQAPQDATLVVFHSAVLMYVEDDDERAAFARSVAELDAVWIANEWPRRIPGLPEAVARERPAGDDFLMCVDGRPTAWADGHGTWVDWR